MWFIGHPRWRAFCFSTLWLSLLLFFTYTPLASALIHSDMSFMTEYTRMQCQMIAMVVNFGLVFMLIVDAWGAKQVQEVWQQICNFLSFFLVIGIYWHSSICFHDELGNYICILNRRGLALLLHVILLALLLCSKTHSLYQSYVKEIDKPQQEF